MISPTLTGLLPIYFIMLYTHNPLSSQEATRWSSTSNQKNTVFISYARVDSDAATRLRDDLQRAGLVAWLDREVIPSQNRDNEIRRAIESSRYVIALISSKSIEKIGSIQLDNQSEFQKADLLARLDDCEIPAELKNIKYVDLFPDWEEGIRSILRAMGVPSTEQTLQTIRSVYEKLEKYRDKLLHIDGRNHTTSSY